MTRGTLARTYAEYDWPAFAALRHKLMNRARCLYQDEPSVPDLHVSVYVVDSTLIDFSLAQTFRAMAP